MRVPVTPIPPYSPEMGPMDEGFDYLEGAGEVLEQGGEFALKARKLYEFGKCEDESYDARGVLWLFVQP